VTDTEDNKFSIDFENDKTNYSKKKGGLKSETIARAMGSGRYGFRVLDLSAGLAIDAVFLVQLGFTLTAVERNPLIYLCLQNALDLVRQNNPDSMLAKNLKFTFANSAEFLQSLSVEVAKNADAAYDVVYFDPMFPDKTKSALPRQEMVFFKKLVGADEDAAEVLKRAAEMPGVKRVAVKRPLKAPILGAKPVASIEGKLIRFDVYGVKKHE
jgi:16S rRNA (guanine1516-N2)-methyltransferase